MQSTQRIQNRKVKVDKKKVLPPLLFEAMQVVHKKYLSKPYTDIFTQKSLIHYNDLAQVQLKRGIVLRPNHNIIHSLRSLRYIRYIIEILLKHGVPSLQLQLLTIKNRNELESFCRKLEFASLFKVTGRDSEVSRSDSAELYNHYKIQSGLFFRDFVDHSQKGRELFSTIDERDYYQKKVIEDLGNPFNQHLPQLILRLAHDLDLQRCRTDEVMRTLHQMYDNQLLQSGYTFEPLWQFAKSCIWKTGGSVITGYNEHLYTFTENPAACWEVLSSSDPYDDPLYRESIKGNLNLTEISRIIRKSNAIARVVSIPGLELKMLSDPRYVRPVIETTKDRTLYTEQKDNKSEKIHYTKRPRKPYEVIEKQPVILSMFNLPKQLGSISFDKDRGKPKETPYSKKMPGSLVHTNGKYTPYSDNRLGFLYDDALLHHKGNRYIWTQNAGSLTKPWLNGLLTHSITKSALKAHMRINTNDKINNELLRGLTRHALRALFYPYHSMERINLFYEYVVARNLHHNFPRIPLLLWEYDSGNIYFYDIHLIRADLAKQMQRKTLSAEKIYEICSILNIKHFSHLTPDQLASEIIEEFVQWEYTSFIDSNEKARELLFQQIVSILENMKSQKDLKSLGIFCEVSGKLFQQPVELNCKSTHVVNFETLIRRDQSTRDDCVDLACPICKQPITEIQMAHAVIDKMYGIVADIIQNRGIRAILDFTGCTINFNSIQSLFNRSEQIPINIMCLVARNLAEQAIKKNNLYLLTRLLKQDHLSKHICSNYKLAYLAALSHSNQMLDCLIQHGTNINDYDEDLGTPLHYAALGNQSTAIRKLLKHGAKLNSINKDGLTALYMAAQYGKIAALDTLLQVPSLAIDLINPYDGNTPFLIAVKYGHHEVVEKLLHSGANISHINHAGDSALHIAAEYGHEKVIALLLNNGANVNHMDQSYETPFFRAAAYGRERALLMLLEKNLQSIDKKNISGDTALHLAVKFGRITTVKILLDNKANMEVLNTDGESPLHLAIKFNRQEIVRELMQHGADDTCKNRCGETPFMLAKKNFDKSLLACFLEEQKCKSSRTIRSSL